MAQTPSEKSLHNKKFHSVPVPQLYKEASKILKRMENREGSLKTLVYSSKYKVNVIMANRPTQFSTVTNSTKLWSCSRSASVLIWQVKVFISGKSKVHLIDLTGVAIINILFQLRFGYYSMLGYLKNYSGEIYSIIIFFACKVIIFVFYCKRAVKGKIIGALERVLRARSASMREKICIQAALSSYLMLYVSQE